MRISLIVVSLALAGCASSSGVLSTGGDTYMTTATAAPARGGIAGAANIAYHHAAAQCTSEGRRLQVISEETGHDFPAAGRDVLRFRCVPVDSPASP